MTFITDINQPLKPRSPGPLYTSFNSKNSVLQPSQRSALLLAAHFNRVIPQELPQGKIQKTSLARAPQNSVEPKLSHQRNFNEQRPRTTKPRFYRLREAPPPEVIFNDEFLDDDYKRYLEKVQQQFGGFIIEGNKPTLAQQRKLLRPVTSISKALKCQREIGELNVELYKFQ